MTMTAQETANLLVKIEIIRNVLANAESLVTAYKRMGDTEQIKKYYAIIQEEQLKMDAYKETYPDLFI